MRRVGLVFVLAMIGCACLGQPTDSGFGDGMAERMEYTPDLGGDVSLFHIPLDGASDVFSQLSRFNFSAVRYARRGYDGRYAAYTVEGIDLSDPLAGRVNYSVVSALRYVPGRSDTYDGLTASGDRPGGLSGVTDYTIRPAEAAAAHRAAVYASGRRYAFGGRASSVGNIGRRGWLYAVSASRRWGWDAYIDGVFTDQTQASLAIQKQFSPDHSLTFFLVAAPSKQGVRTSAAQEAFDLTGNNLYNPSWGWREGRQVNSKVREDFQPFGLVNYARRLNERTRVEVSLSALGGRRAYSGLRWYRADNPYPDYYRKLPGYVREHAPGEYEDALAAWRTSDPASTQVDWDLLIARNKGNAANDEQAAYVIENRVEQTRHLQLAGRVERRIDDRLSVTGGVRVRRDHSRNFKEVKDLLGGGWLVDVDEFLVDDAYYGDRTQNDVRHPNRRVGEGDRFGYDYLMRSDHCGVFGQVRYEDRSFRFTAGVEGAAVSIWRQGCYEKEMFPGAESFGRSKTIRLTTYSVQATVGYSFSPRHSIDLGGIVSESAPAYDQLFFSPRYRNRTVDKPRAIAVAGGELTYRMTLRSVRIKVSGFHTRTSRETDVYQYYDDLLGVYSDMVVAGIEKLYYGAELGAEIRFTSRLALHLAGTVSSYTYESNPAVDTWSDVDGSELVRGSKSSMKGLRIGSTPQQAASIELKYSGVKGWYATVALNRMGGRYVHVNPLRRMPRVLAHAKSREAFAQFATQERLPDAATVNLFAAKTFRFGPRTLTLTVSVNNLLGRNDIVYSGYEPMRLERIGFENRENATFRPFANKYLYSYGRTYYVGLSGQF